MMTTPILAIALTQTVTVTKTPLATTDTLTYFLPDPLIAAFPHEWHYDQENGPGVTVMLENDVPAKWIVARHRYDRPFEDDAISKGSIRYNLIFGQQPYRFAKAEIARSERSAKSKQKEGVVHISSADRFALDVGDVGSMRVSQATIPQGKTIQSPELGIYSVNIDVAGHILAVSGSQKGLYTGNAQVDLAAVTTLSRRITAFAIGEKSTSNLKLHFGDFTVPGKKFFVYPNRMANWNSFAETHGVTWRYLPETAEIQIAGRTPIQLHLGTRTYHIGNQKWVADAPVTLHNKEFYIEENAMATILNAL